MLRSHENWPAWWKWELDCSNPHLTKRMIGRSFNEVDLRLMLERAISYRPDTTAGRWIIDARHRGTNWEVIVEPDIFGQVLIVVTAFPVDSHE